MSELKMSKITMLLVLGAVLGLVVMLVPYTLLHMEPVALRIDQETLKESPTDIGNRAEKLVVTSITWADIIKIAAIVALGVIPALTISIFMRRRVET